MQRLLVTLRISYTNYLIQFLQEILELNILFDSSTLQRLLLVDNPFHLLLDSCNLILKNIAIYGTQGIVKLIPGCFIIRH